MLIANKEEIFTYIEEDFNRLKNYDFHHTSFAYVELCILLAIRTLDKQDNVATFLNKEQEFYLLNLLLKLEVSFRDYILKQVIAYMFNENEAERIRQILEENKEKGKRNAQYH